MVCPPSSQSRAAVRRNVMMGVAHRTISSTAPGIRASRSWSSQARWSGKSVSAFMPWLVLCRVVSLPATMSSPKNDTISSSVSRSPSTSACTSAVSRSFFGSARRATMSSVAIARTMPEDSINR